MVEDMFYNAQTRLKAMKSSKEFNKRKSRVSERSSGSWDAAPSHHGDAIAALNPDLVSILLGINDFYAELAEAKETGFEDAGTAEFIHCLVASADYDSFYSVMVREAMKLGASSKPMKYCAPKCQVLRDCHLV